MQHEILECGKYQSTNTNNVNSIFYEQSNTKRNVESEIDLFLAEKDTERTRGGSAVTGKGRARKGHGLVGVGCGEGAGLSDPRSRSASIALEAGEHEA